MTNIGESIDNDWCDFSVFNFRPVVFLDSLVVSMILATFRDAIRNEMSVASPQYCAYMDDDQCKIKIKSRVQDQAMNLAWIMLFVLSFLVGKIYVTHREPTPPAPLMSDATEAMLWFLPPVPFPRLSTTLTRRYMDSQEPRSSCTNTARASTPECEEAGEVPGWCILLCVMLLYKYIYSGSTYQDSSCVVQSALSRRAHGASQQDQTHKPRPNRQNGKRRRLTMSTPSAIEHRNTPHLPRNASKPIGAAGPSPPAVPLA